MLQIPQGKPTSPYFGVFLPGNQQVATGEQVECKHPVTGKLTSGTCEFIINEPWIRIPEWLCYSVYGVSAIEIKKALEARFEAFRKTDMVKVIFVKKN